MESLNRMAIELVDEAIDFADELAIEVHAHEGEVSILDFGVHVPGAIEAGLLLSEIQTAGLATVQTTLDTVASSPRTYVELSTDQPALSLLCAGKAGWEVTTEEFDGLGSGPARALVAEEDIFQRIAYQDDFEFAVLVLESDTLPDDVVIEQVADRAGVPASGVFLPTYATASLTGSVVAASRVAELAAYRLAELGYDPLDILSATGRAPVAPVADTERGAIARTNDALAYGGEVHLVVDEPFDQFDAVASTASEEFDAPFAEIFDSSEWSFEEIPRGVFAPAQVTIDVRGGETHVIGETNEAVLAESFGIQ